ncbi:phage tail protein [Oribacterium sp. C9]|uniref:baseplate J/gp47 family protein n=1 Tax=Oribacterium sp. C9 TaxID=1943579 RepID=UPI00098EB68F|nr:baseplate J/gp47 family protein [Oribacterium sp. C9]OON85926.1 phage tail protein [Oribacterium sp. C9]
MYESVTYDVILQRMLDRVSDKLDKRPGAVIWDTHSPTAIELQVLYIELDQIYKETFGDTASREFLIKRAKERGLSPYPATSAVLRGEFTPSTIDVIGKRFNLSYLNYVVTEKISDGVYQVTCETPGESGNQHFGSLVPIDYIDGLETATLTDVLIPGEDEEDTEEFRTRYYNSFNDLAFGGNLTDYKNKVKALSGVGDVKITRVWNSDIHPADMIPSSAVQSWYSSYIETVSDADVKLWLQTVYAAALNKKLTVGGTVKLTIIASDYSVPSSTLINTVQTAVDPEQNAGEGVGFAPIGHVVNVIGVSATAINITAHITFSDGYSWDTLEISVKNSISAYLLTLRQGWADEDSTTVRIAQIESCILGTTGVIDVSNTTINGAEENLTLGRDEVPVLGTVTPI